MQLSHIDATRRSQANFQNQLKGMQPQQGHGRLNRFGPSPETRGSGRQEQFRTLLQLLAVTHAVGAGLPRPVPAAAAMGMSVGVAAQTMDGMREPLMPSHTSLSDKLHVLGNAALTTCLVRPRQCPEALKAAALGAAAFGITAAGSGLTGFALGRATAPDCDAPPLVDHPPSDESADALLQQLPLPQQDEVLEIVRRCRGDRDCALPALRAILAELPPDTQRAVAHLLGDSQPRLVEASGSGGWPPGAAAQALPMDWIDHAAALLAGLHDAEAAELQRTVDAISQATLDAQRTFDNGRSHRRFDPAYERRVNQARLDEIRTRFEQHGLGLEEHNFTLNAVSDMGERGVRHGRNLFLELVGEGPVRRTLLLMAHGDTGGASLRSSGAWSNGSGVAALQVMARRFAEQGVPAGTRVQLLISDLGREGWVGAKAFVQRCQADGTCPDLTVNLDRLGWGDALAISGTDRHTLVNEALEHPGQRDPRPVAALEARFVEHLRAAAAAHQLPVADVPAWSLVSDQIPLQREGLPAVGLTQSSPAEMDHGARFLQARERMNAAADAVAWEHYDAYTGGRLDPALRLVVSEQISRWRAARAEFAAVGMPRVQRVADTAQDQPGQVNARAALRVADAAHQAALAWLREAGV